jgi:WD40 repeat protein/DNA-directed RNA polymerase subunit RPC12/RpoP
MSEPFKFDVFISHSVKDRLAARELAQRLKADGLRVWFVDWEVRPGRKTGPKIQEGLEQSRTLVLMLSSKVSTSEWVTFESQTILFIDPLNPQRRFIPLRLDDAEIKGTLKQFAYIDWRHKSGEEYAQLISACRPSTFESRTPAAHVVLDEPRSDKVLKGHAGIVQAVALSSDGRLAVSGSDDRTVRVWDLSTGVCVATLEGHTGWVRCVAVTSDGRLAVSGSDDRTVRVWDIQTGRCDVVLEGHTGWVRGVAVSAEGGLAVSGSDDRTVRVWDIQTGRCNAVLEGHTDYVLGVALTPDGRLAVSGSGDNTVRVWDLVSNKCVRVLEGHTDYVLGAAVTADGRLAVSGSADNTIRVWEPATGKCLSTLEGHTGIVFTVATGLWGQVLVSGSADNTLRVWDLSSGRCIATLRGHTAGVNGVAVTHDSLQVVSGSNDGTVRVWELPAYNKIPAPELEASRYTNAKVLLVGDSGVGKSGLALRLTEDKFEPTVSTDAAWATQLKLPHEASGGDIEREIWLWDFAGQADYRLIHQLFMDETALAVLVFNPQSENPFEGLGQWDRDLQRAARRPFRKLLVAGRCDRGGLMVSRAVIERFCKERGFDRYLETSAYAGTGCDELRQAIIKNIPWEDIPWTSSPRIFKLLKEEIIKLKDEGKALLRVGELKQQLEMRLPGETFTLEQLRAVVGLLAGPGVVWQLEFGDFVLLIPERINAYAAAVIRKVRAHTEEIGVIGEEDVLAGKLDYQDMRRLPPDEEQIVLRAMHQILVGRGLCLRVVTESGMLLVFPSYFKRERPELQGHPAVFVTYQFNGALDEIYSTLVVRLHHAPSLEMDQLWRFAADFKTQAGRRVGLKMAKRPEGSAEIAVYFEPGVTDETKVTFIKYVHEHLKLKAQEVMRLRHYVCPHCGTPVENRKTALERLERGLKDIQCVNCDKRIMLWDLIEEKFASEDFQRRVREMEEQARASIDNESRELILAGHAFAVAGEAGQIFRPTANSDLGIDGEIEFKDDNGEASGKRVYLRFRPGGSYLQTRRADGKEVFRIHNRRQIGYWRAQPYPVMLVARTSDGAIRWMNVTEYLRRNGPKTRQIIFEGEPFTALSVIRLRDSLITIEMNQLVSGEAEESRERAERGQRLLKEGDLDAAITEFQQSLSSEPTNRDAREGLLAIARRCLESAPARVDVAINTLKGNDPDWLAARLCQDVTLADVSVKPAIDLSMEMKPVPVTFVAAATNGFGWELELTPVEAKEPEVKTLRPPLRAERIGSDRVRLMSDTTDVPWGLYLLTVRFLAAGREHWSASLPVSNVEPRNPYVAGPPVRKREMFFGRQAAINEVQSLLEDYSVVLLGPRRSGKTSFLYHLAKAYEGAVTTVSIDLHSFAIQSTPEMAASLRRHVYRSCLPDATAPPPADLHELQSALWDGGVRRLILLLDEMAVLEDHPLMAFQLRAVSKWQQPDTRLVVAGTASDLLKVVDAAVNRGSSPFNEFGRFELEELTRQDAQELLEKPVVGYYRYEPAAVELLLASGGGRPFHLNALAQFTLKAVQAGGGKVITVAHVESARREATYELGQWFREFIMELDPATRSKLPELVHAKSARALGPYTKSLWNAGLTVGPRHSLHLCPLFTDWWVSREGKEG